MISYAESTSRFDSEEVFAMTRLLVCGMLAVGASAAARAGELDKESAPTKTTPTVAKASAAPTELDQESPTPAHYWRGYGYRSGFYAGIGYGGFYGGYGVGFYRPFVSYGFAYPAYYYSPYRAYYRAGYYGYGCW